MSSSLTGILLVISCLAFIAVSAPDASAFDSPTAYQLLEYYGFPVGLLPRGVTRYQLDAATGKFAVYLNETCSFTIQGYDLKYRTKITGTISTGKIKNLNGIQVKVLLFWVNIIEVTKEGTDLELSVGIASAGFPVDNFNDSPQCGCGFDCVTERQRSGRFGFKRLVPLLDM